MLPGSFEAPRDAMAATFPTQELTSANWCVRDIGRSLQYLCNIHPVAVPEDLTNQHPHMKVTIDISPRPDPKPSGIGKDSSRTGGELSRASDLLHPVINVQ